MSSHKPSHITVQQHKIKTAVQLTIYTTPCLKKTSHLWLAIILTCTILLR